MGDGTTGLTSAGSAVFVDEYTPAGAFVQSIPMPTNTAGSNNPLVASGTATSEGFLNVSNNGSVITLSGYGRALGGSGSLASSSSTTVPRIVGVVNVGTGAVDTTTALTDWASGNNPRSVASPDGSSFYLAGAAGGIRYATIGATNSVQLNSGTTAVNFRTINTATGNIYVSASSSNSGSTAIRQLGSGLSNATGQTLTGLTGLPSPTNASSYQFVLEDENPNIPGVDTLYYADDTTGGGGIEKYVLNAGGTWVFSGSASASAIRGLAATVDGSGVHLFGTTGGSTASGGGALYTFTDTSGTNSISAGAAATALISSLPTDEAFRGIAIVPVATPEPTSIALLGVGVAATLRRRRR